MTTKNEERALFWAWIGLASFIAFAVFCFAARDHDAPRKAQEDTWRRRAAIYAEEFQKRGLVAVPVPTEEK